MSKKILMILLILLLLTGCRKAEEPVPELQEPVGVSMDIAVVERGPMRRLYFYTGVTTPASETVSSREDGRLETVNVHYGDIVKKGDVLAVLDRKEADRRIQEAEKAIEHQKEIDALVLEQLQYALDSSRSVLNELYANGVSWAGRRMQALDVEEKELALKQAQESQALEITRLETALEQLQKQSEDRELTAPCDGQITYVNAGIQDGAYIHAYEDLFAIADTSVLYAVTDHVPDSVLTKAETLTASIGGQPHAVTEVPYSKEEMLSMILSQDAAVCSRFRIEKAEDVHAGDPAVVYIELLKQEDVLKIPANALNSDENGSFVYQIIDGHRTRKSVSTGLITDTEVQITEGLEEGDQVYVQN